MSLQLVVSLIGLGLVLAGVLVQLGRVLQRQDAAEEAGEKTSKEHGDAIAALKESRHDQDSALQAVVARVDGLGADHQRGAEKVSELRTQFHEIARTLTALREDLVGRLARIEGYVEHHSAPPPPPTATAFNPGAPRRSTIPGEPR